MTFTYQLSTTLGKARLYIPDRVKEDAFFSDEELQALLDDNAQSAHLAAAQALEIMASDDAMVLKVMKMGKLSLDGKSTADALVARATRLRQTATEVALAVAEPEPGFEIAELVVDELSYQQALERAYIREA